MRCYTETISFTSLKVIGKTNSKQELSDMVKANYEDCGGLLQVIDLDHENDPSIPFQG
jgi:hypothetical protein